MNNTIKALLISSLLAVSSFSQETVTAQVPVITNVAAKVSIQPNSTANGTGTERNLAAGVEETLEIQLNTTTVSQDPNDPNPILSQGQIRAVAVVRYERGRVFIELNPSFKNADISLFSLNGKQILHGKASGSESLNISQSNMSEGIYLLLVKGSGGNSQSAKLMHRGGTLNINATFSGSINSQSVSAALAKAGDYGTWTITATADGYMDTSYAFQPDAGTNNPLQTITLHPLTPLEPEAMTAKSALQYFKDENIKAGWNLGNTLDAVNVPSTAVETAWGNPVATQQLLNGVKESGFDIVRIGCTWIGHIGSAPDYKVSEARLKRVAEVVNMVHNAGMKAIINIHHDGNYTEPEKGTWGFVKFAEVLRGTATRATVEDQLGKVWTQIAEYFKNYGDYLIFETLNEVHSGNWGSNYSPGYAGYSYANEQDMLFAWNTIALDAIRATGGNNATRFVAVPGLGGTEPHIVIDANNSNKLLPDDGANGTDKLIVAVHFYSPGQYTVAEATPTQGGEGWYLKHTLTSEELTEIDTEAYHLKTNFIDNGIAVYYGEWGAPTETRSSMSTTIKNTHINYIGRVAAAAHANGIVPIIWDDGGNFKMLERSNGKPKTGLWADVLEAYINAVNTPILPTDIEGNLGNYAFGVQEDNVTPNYDVAQWNLSDDNRIIAQTDGAKLVLQLTNAPTASMVLVWQGPLAGLYWQEADIFKDGEPTSDSVEWDEGTKTLTITLNEDTIDGYDTTFKSQLSLNLLIGYWSSGSVNDLGIVSANLEVDD